MKGDILLARARVSFTHAVIAVGQKVGFSAGRFRQMFGLSAGQNLDGSAKATTVHAGIYVGQGMVSQSHGGGLTTDELTGGDTWKVYRYEVRRDIAYCAADIADNLVVRATRGNDPGFGGYGFARAFKSAILDPRSQTTSTYEIYDFLDNIDKSARARQFFCSNFVVLCYSLASEFLTSNPHYCIRTDYERASPAAMARYFEDHHREWIRQPREIRG